MVSTTAGESWQRDEVKIAAEIRARFGVQALATVNTGLCLLGDLKYQHNSSCAYVIVLWILFWTGIWNSANKRRWDLLWIQWHVLNLESCLKNRNWIACVLERFCVCPLKRTNCCGYGESSVGSSPGQDHVNLSGGSSGPKANPDSVAEYMVCLNRSGLVFDQWFSRPVVTQNARNTR